MKNGMIKKTVETCLAFVFLISPIYLKAQTSVELDPEFGGRLSLSLDKKLTKGLHISLEEEMRMNENFTSFSRLQTTVGITYKLDNHFKLGFGYAMINPYSSGDNAFKAVRHRFMADVTGSLRLGDWRLSLKERLQATYRTGDMNIYQSPRTALTLKSRLRVSYKGMLRIEPYAYIEMRNTFNAPVINATYNTATDTWGYYNGTTFTQKGEAGWFLDGFTGCYVNRLRGSIGFEYKFDKRSSLDISLMVDRIMDKVVDANAEGTKLKSYTRETGLVGWLVAGYNYQF